jgi:hypothetical protein
MPAFGGRITRKQARDLVAYIRSLGAPAIKAAADHENSFDVQFRELQEEFERLRKQFKDLSEQSKR